MSFRSPVSRSLPSFLTGALVVFMSQAVAVQAHSHTDEHAASHAGHDDAKHATPNTSQLPPLPQTVTFRDCWVRAMPAPLPSGGYMQLQNQSDSPVTLTGAAAQPFGMTMLHATTTEDGVASMAHIPSVEVAAGSSLELKPGGYHLMFEEPHGELTIGDTLNVQLHFEGHAPREVSCEIRTARGESQR